MNPINDMIYTYSIGSPAVVLNSDGSTFAEVDHLVKQTASSNSNIAIIAGIAFIVTVVGSCLIVRQVRTEN